MDSVKCRTAGHRTKRSRPEVNILEGRSSWPPMTRRNGIDIQASDSYRLLGSGRDSITTFALSPRHLSEAVSSGQRNRREELQDLRGAVARDFDCRELMVSQFTPVMGAHTGPGLLGLAFHTDYNSPVDGPDD